MSEGRSKSVASPPWALVAGIGNVLRGDDGFGPMVVRALQEDRLPTGVRVVEVGIGGIALVHELMDGYEVLVLIDAVDRGGEPGTLYVLEPEPLSDEEAPRGIDMHEVVPGRVLVLAQALGVLPPVVRILGCQPAETEGICTELTPAVRRAVPAALETIHGILDASRARP